MSYEEIVWSVNAVNVTDGINREEAVVLAQKYLIDYGLDVRHSVYRVGKVSQEGEWWEVQFNAGVARGASATWRFDFVEPIVIKVDAATGEARR